MSLLAPGIVIFQAGALTERVENGMRWLEFIKKNITNLTSGVYIII